MLDYFLQRAIKSGVKKYNRNRSFVSFNKINDILILFEIDQWNELQPIINDLEKNNKRVIAWTIRTTETPSIQFPSFVKVVEPQDITWLNLFKANITDEFDKLSYDTLLDFTDEYNNYLFLLLLRNKSKFCIGFIERECKIYDFILLKNKSQNLNDAYFEMKKYIEYIQ